MIETRSLKYFHSLKMISFTSTSVSCSDPETLSCRTLSISDFPAGLRVSHVCLSSSGPAPVPAPLRADRRPSSLGLGPTSRQWTRLQRQGDNLQKPIKPGIIPALISRLHHRMGSQWSSVCRTPTSLPRLNASCP